MVEWLAIEHLFELSTGEQVAALFAPLLVFIALAIATVILPGKWVPGYVNDEQTGKPRRYRLNGLLVSVIAILIWGLEVIPGLDREWFYRTSLFAVAGGTGFAVLFTAIAVYTQPKTGDRNRIVDFYLGRVQEIRFFNDRLDLKMTFYVVGSTMLSINAMSGAAWHYEQFSPTNQVNLGVFVYAAIFTFYVFDDHVFERVRLYTFDLIHERMGFKMFWGDNIAYGWLYILPLYGMAAYPDPGFSTAWTYVWIIGVSALFLVGWGIARGANIQKYTFKRWPERKFLGIIEPRYIQAGDRKILTSGFWGVSRHFNYMGEILWAVAVGLSFGHFDVVWPWTYLIFIVGLFTLRQRQDDALCAEKYGEKKWAEYQQQVPYRIVPGIY
jgi:delta14-sterol reductase